MGGRVGATPGRVDLLSTEKVECCACWAPCSGGRAVSPTQNPNLQWAPSLPRRDKCGSCTVCAKLSSESSEVGARRSEFFSLLFWACARKEGGGQTKSDCKCPLKFPIHRTHPTFSGPGPVILPFGTEQPPPSLHFRRFATWGGRRHSTTGTT